MNKKHYYREMITIGLPITLQSIFQAGYSFVDQIMVGQLGAVSIAGSGLGGKFSSLVIVTLSAIATVASILIAQYRGKKDVKGISQSFYLSGIIAVFTMLLFLLPSVFVPETLMKLYTQDQQTFQMGAMYLRVIALGFLPMTGTLMLSAYLRSMECSKYPLYTSIVAMFCNIAGNYLFIFGKFGLPEMGLKGAAISTTFSRFLEFVLLLCFFYRIKKEKNLILKKSKIWNKGLAKTMFIIMIPILLNEFLWSLGENIYTAVYARLGTDALAAMTMTGPLQGLFVGMFTGISSAAVVMIGVRLGKNEFEESYQIAKIMMRVSFLGSVFVGGMLMLLAGFYVNLFRVEQQVKQLAVKLLFVFALFLFVKVLNMVISGGIFRSGGKTKITLVIDLIGTWGFGIPLALISGIVLKLPVYQVYAILSLEELVRLLIGFVVFQKKTWMQNLVKEEKKN